MDKHQRRALQKWETKRAKDQEKFEEYLRRHSQEQAQIKIDRVVNAWQPHHSAVFSAARELSAYPIVHFGGRTRIIDILNGYHWHPLLISNRVKPFMTELDIAAEIAEKKAWKQASQAYDLSRVLRRHRVRVDAIRDELEMAARKFRAIQNCRNGFKEELMMVVWHPRRVERILETYGWEAYENLLGLE